MPHPKFLLLLCAALAGLALHGPPAGAQPADVAGAAAEAVDPAVARVGEALQLPEVFRIMAQEGAAYGTSLEDDMFAGRGGAPWAVDVARIYAPDRVYPVFLAALSGQLAGSPHLAEIERFLASGLARRAVTLEVSARRAMLDPAVDEAARMKLDDLAAEDAEHYRLVTEFIEANDLLETNVAGGLNAAHAFYRGLFQGGAFTDDMTEEQMLQDVWAQEPAIREESEAWLGALLNMAYAPLSAAELRDYIAFSRSPAGHALNNALFAAYDQAFSDVSQRLGRAAAKYIAGETL